MTSTHAPTAVPAKKSTISRQQPRLDNSTAAHVEEALALQNNFGTLCALEFMKAKGIPNQITARVLGQPEKRRLRD